MPGIFPIPKFTTVDLTSETPTMVSRSISGIVQRKQVATHFFKLALTMPTLSVTEARQVIAFLAKQRNTLFDFTIVIPGLSDSNGDIIPVQVANPGETEVMTVTTIASAGASSVLIDTAYTSAMFTAASKDATAALRAGDLISFSNHNKVYQITDDVTFNATGGGTINIFPNLLNALAVTDTVNYDDVAFTVISENASQKYKFMNADVNKIRLALREAI